MGSSLPTKAGPSTAGTTNTTGTSNVTTSLAPWFTQQWQDILNQGGNLANNQNYYTMGLTPDQMTSSIATNNLLDSWLSQPQPSAYDVFGMASTPFQAPQANMNGTTAANAFTPQQATAATAQAAQGQAGQLYPTEIAPFMNPYLANAIDPTLNRLQQQQWDTSGRINADAAASGMFGGSRGAVANAIGDRDYRTNLAQTAGNMLNQGWNNAAGLAQYNVGNRQATSAANAQLQNAVNLANAQNQTSVSQSNAANAAARANNAAQIGGQLAGQQLQSNTQTNLANMGAQNATAQADANRFLAALAQQGNTNSQNLQGTLSIIQLLNTLGGQQQQTGQNALNNYWQNLNNLFNLLKVGVSPGTNVAGQTTSLGNTTGTTQQPINLGQIALGGIGLLSDPKDKTDITKLGKDPQSGVDMYAYRYKGDPKTYPKVVGPMSPDIERLMPGVTRLIGGHRVVGG
jgi:hypothetical protein